MSLRFQLQHPKLLRQRKISIVHSTSVWMSWRRYRLNSSPPSLSPSWKHSRWTMT
ncbi:hypothetical protein D3C81_2071700 [compost metagenome]